MNKSRVAVAGLRCKSWEVELPKRISLDPFDDLIQNIGVQVPNWLAVLCGNAPVHQGEETRSEGVGQMLRIKSAGGAARLRFIPAQLHDCVNQCVVQTRFISSNMSTWCGSV